MLVTNYKVNWDVSVHSINMGKCTLHVREDSYQMPQWKTTMQVKEKTCDSNTILNGKAIVTLDFTAKIKVDHGIAMLKMETPVPRFL